MMRPLLLLVLIWLLLQDLVCEVILALGTGRKDPEGRDVATSQC